MLLYEILPHHHQLMEYFHVAKSLSSSSDVFIVVKNFFDEVDSSNDHSSKNVPSTLLEFSNLFDG